MTAGFTRQAVMLWCLCSVELSGPSKKGVVASELDATLQRVLHH